MSTRRVGAGSLMDRLDRLDRLSVSERHRLLSWLAVVVDDETWQAGLNRVAAERGVGG